MSTLIQNEIDIINALNDFNQKYANYTRCNYATNYGGIVSGNCSVQPSDLTASYGNVTAAIANMNDILAESTTNVDQTKYTADHDKIISNYNEVVKLRTNLDNQLKELYRVKYSSSAEYQKDLDRSVYINLFLTILITSVAYFTFLKLK